MLGTFSPKARPWWEMLSALLSHPYLMCQSSNRVHPCCSDSRSGGDSMRPGVAQHVFLAFELGIHPQWARCTPLLSSDPLWVSGS